MIRLEPPLRFASEADARELADLVNFAGEGLPLYIWEGLAKDGQDPWEVGRARQTERVREGQIVVVDFGDGAVASLTGYPIGSEPKPIGDDFPALFRPLQELENKALESWYVNVLACYPEYRGQGLGSRLLNLAEQIARDGELRRMSVIVANNNAGARRLYERHGYEEVAALPCVKEGWETDTEHWVLLTKPLSLVPVHKRLFFCGFERLFAGCHRFLGRVMAQGRAGYGPKSDLAAMGSWGIGRRSPGLL